MYIVQLAAKLFWIICFNKDKIRLKMVYGDWLPYKFL